MINLGIHAEGQQSQDRLFLYNAGTDSLYLSDFPQSRYFDFSYAPSFDTNTDEEMQPGNCVAVDIVDKKNLPAGKIMVTVKTSPVTGKPAVKLAKVSRQGTKRNVTVTFTVPKSCDWNRLGTANKLIILKSCLNLEINNVLFMTDKGHMRHQSLWSM